MSLSGRGLEGHTHKIDVDYLQEYKTQSDGIARSFTRFSRLPTELRLEVWGFAACIPRCVDIRIEDIGDIQYKGRQPPDYLMHCRHWVSRNAVPSILHTSREAREVGLKFYKLAFEYPVGDLDFHQPFACPPQIYINHDRDVLCPIEFGMFHGYTQSYWWKEVEGIRQIAINISEEETDNLSFAEVAHSVREIILYSFPKEEPVTQATQTPGDEGSGIVSRIRADTFVHIGFVDLEKSKRADSKEWKKIESGLVYYKQDYEKSNEALLWAKATKGSLHGRAAEATGDSIQYFTDLDPEVLAEFKEKKEELEKEQASFQFKFKVIVLNGQECL